MKSKKMLFLAHDPGGYDVTGPIVERARNSGDAVEYCCIGPAAKLNPADAATERQVIELLVQGVAEQSISVLVTGRSWNHYLERQAVKICKENGIPTVTVLDYWSNYTLADENGVPCYPDRYIVMDELAQVEAIAEGVPEDIIVILGQPALDKFVRFRTEERKFAAPPFPIMLLSQPLSLLYGERLGFTEHDFIGDCLEHIQSKPGWLPQIKFHPKDSEALIRRYARYEVKGNLSELLPKFHAVIGMNSIGLLHAVLMGVHALSYEPNLREPDLCITNKLGLTRRLADAQQLGDALDKLLEEGTKRQGDVDSRLLRQGKSGPAGRHDPPLSPERLSDTGLDGRATERIYHYIKELCGNHAYSRHRSDPDDIIPSTG